MSLVLDSSDPSFFEYIYMGASMVKWTNIVLWYTKTIFVLVKVLRVVAKCCLIWIIFHNDLYCCVEYCNVEYQIDIFKTYH